MSVAPWISESFISNSNTIDNSAVLHLDEYVGNQSPNPGGSNSSSSAFKVQPVVPLKRGYPRDDLILQQHSLNTPAPGSINPQAAFLGVNNGSLSPGMQGFGNLSSGQPPPKRVATQSPTHFPPNAQHAFATPTVSSTSNPGVLTPQTQFQQPTNPNLLQNFMGQTRSFSPPARTSSSSPMPAGSPQALPQNAHNQALYNQLQRQNQQRMFQQSAQPNAALATPNQGGVMPGVVNASPNPNARMTNRAQPNPDQFLKALQEFMTRRGTPLTSLTFSVGDRQISLVFLYASVMRMGGSRAVTNGNLWPNVATMLNISLEAFPNAPELLMKTYFANLAPYEDAWQTRAQNEKKLLALKQNSATAAAQEQGSTKPQSQQQTVQQGGPVAATPSKQQANIGQPKPGQHPAVETGNKVGSSSDTAQLQALKQQEKAAENNFQPKVRRLDTHGGFEIGVLRDIGNELAHFRPTVPSYGELGSVDIHALIMGLKSGMQAEVRVALDTLVTVSVESQWSSLLLKNCEGLVEALVEVVETDVSFLAKNTKRVERYPKLISYEEVLRRCRLEASSVAPSRNNRGDLEHDLERAADRVIGVTTILRNLSFFESNHGSLAEVHVIKLAATIVHIMGTSTLLLQNYANTLDFMKDIIIFLSNLAQAIILPDEDAARALLLLILSFAPQEQPQVQESGGPLFSTYHPSIHRYLPPAVDSLAKLLARDEPNRGFFRHVICSELSFAHSNELLTLTFGLAISPIPLHDNIRSVMLPQVVETRKPYLEQGLLAAEILVDFISDSDTQLANDWLCSEDAFATNLLKFICLLSPHQNPVGRTMQPKMYGLDDCHPFARIVHRGLVILEKLLHKAGFMDESLMLEEGALEKAIDSFPFGIVPRKEVVIGTVLSSRIDASIVSALVNFASMAEEL